MKLRHRETGEIRPAEAREDGIYVYNEINEQWYRYELPLLAAYWEYYEEPHETYRLTPYGEVVKFSSDGISNAHKRECVNIGNHFSTEEEAEKAAKKLKAWKRLKDKGLEFNGWCDRGDEPIGEIRFRMPKIGQEWSEDENADLDLLFSGEDD